MESPRITRVFAAVAVATAVVSVGCVKRVAYLPGEPVFSFKDIRIDEASGIQPATRSNDVLFTHNDSMNAPVFYAVGPDGATVGSFTVAGARNIDWEDIGSGPGPNGEPALYIGDIGDNSRARPIRPSVQVYVVAEPIVDPTKDVRTPVAILEEQVFVYEDQPHNASTLLVDPTTGRVAIVTKESNGISGVYVAGDPDPRGVRVLRRHAQIDFNRIADPKGERRGTFATGGDVAPDGSRLVILTYAEAFEWKLRAFDLANAFDGSFVRIDTPAGPHTEAIAYTRDGTGLIVTSEGLTARVHRLRRT